jgi:hypothetical protein
MKEFIYLTKASTAGRVISFDQIWRKTPKLILRRQQMYLVIPFVALLPPARRSAFATRNAVPQVYRGFFIDLAAMQSIYFDRVLVPDAPTVTSNADPLSVPLLKSKAGRLSLLSVSSVA